MVFVLHFFYLNLTLFRLQHIFSEVNFFDFIKEVTDLFRLGCPVGQQKTEVEALALGAGLNCEARLLADDRLVVSIKFATLLVQAHFTLYPQVLQLKNAVSYRILHGLRKMGIRLNRFFQPVKLVAFKFLLDYFVFNLVGMTRLNQVVHFLIFHRATARRRRELFV